MDGIPGMDADADGGQLLGCVPEDILDGDVAGWHSGNGCNGVDKVVFVFVEGNFMGIFDLKDHVDNLWVHHSTCCLGADTSQVI
eukprot:scaffold301172_cov38-Prasinocladus_malaysianus.AAC.1